RTRGRSRSRPGDRQPATESGTRRLLHPGAVGTALTSSSVCAGPCPRRADTAGPRARLPPLSWSSSMEAAALQFGRYFEEFEVGAVYKHWPGKTVTEYDDHLFCLLTMNHHPLHMDAHYAGETTEFGRNVVVGNYIYSLLLGMSV